MATYVQPSGSDTWHWGGNRSPYPSKPAETTRQPSWDLREQCKTRSTMSGLVARSIRQMRWPRRWLASASALDLRYGARLGRRTAVKIRAWPQRG
jgi:hypothetical protein